MRALTITQPWAGLIAASVKLVENRPRRMIKVEDFGKPFAIHASREIDRKAWRGIIEIAPECAIDNPGPMAFAARIHRLAEITSAVIAVATIDACIDEVDNNGLWRDTLDPKLHLRWFFGPIGYVLRDVRALATPVPCKGALGFWRLPPDVAAKVEAQL